MEFQSGTTIEVQVGADICADTVTKNGTTLGNGTQCQGPLPVEMAAITVIAADSGVTLTWATASEVHNYGFFVQRSRDSLKSFEDLPNSFVKGHGTTLGAHKYSYTDAMPDWGRWWYRVRQIDLDGSVHFTEAVVIELARGANDRTLPRAFTLAQNYPNPFNPSTTITIGLPRDAMVSLEVFNTLGQRVVQLVDELMSAGYHYIIFDASQLASGFYLYRMKAGDVVATKKLLVVR